VGHNPLLEDKDFLGRGDFHGYILFLPLKVAGSFAMVRVGGSAFFLIIFGDLKSLDITFMEKFEHFPAFLKYHDH